MRNPIRIAIERIGATEPLLLAHHPTCEYYSHHTIELYGHRLCMGCFVVYPVGFLSLMTLVIARLLWPEHALFGLSTTEFYLVGFALAAPMLAGKLAPGTRARRTRIWSKALLAIGLAHLAFPILFRPGDRLLTAALFVGLLVPYVVHKGLTATDDCEGCPQADDFPNCTGMTFDGEYRYETTEAGGEMGETVQPADEIVQSADETVQPADEIQTPSESE